MDVTSSTLETFRQSMTKPNVIVLYHASWCPHCVVFLPTWKKFSNECQKKYNNVSVYSVEQSMLDNVSWKNTAGKLQKPITSGFPTVKFYSKGNEVSSFADERKTDNLLKFVESNMVKKTKSARPNNNTKELKKVQLKNLVKPVKSKKPVVKGGLVKDKKETKKKSIFSIF